MWTRFSAFMTNLPWLVKQTVWIGFAIVFYQSGYAFTLWLVEPENFTGGLQWVGVGLFPVLLPLFFVVNRFCGCATGRCGAGKCDAKDGPSKHRGGMPLA